MSATFSSADYNFMARAIKLAKLGQYTTSPNPRVGCVLVKDNEIIGEGFHVKAGEGHAEVNAIANANATDTNNTRGATAYVTLEPCSHFGRTPPCAQALIDAGVSKVIAAMVDPNPSVSGRGLAMLESAGIDIFSGLLADEARLLNTGFIHLMTEKLPYVRCKMASSLDGKTAMANGESQWITSKEARKDVQRLRAESCAIISGADSILFDNARMTVRQSELGDVGEHYITDEIRQPVRVIIDTQHKLTPDLALFQENTPIILVRHSLMNHYQWPDFVEEIELPLASDNRHIDLHALLAMLAQKGLNTVLIESGMSLASAFIEQNLVNELILYQAPKLMGHEGKGLVNMPEVAHLHQAKTLYLSAVTLVGHDIKITATFNNNVL